jgi:hypothetical protein
MPVTYKEAERFSWFVSSGIDPKDLVHDSFLQYYYSTGENMFDAPKNVVFQTIKNSYKRRLNGTFYVSNGIRIDHQWFDFKDQIWTESHETTITEEEQERINKLAFNGIIRELKKRASQYPRLPLSTVIDKMDRPTNEIADDLNVSEQSVSYYKNKIRTIAQSMREYQPHNPFNGNNLPVLKVVTRKNYDKNIEKYKDFKNDSDLGADYNESYTLLVNDLKQGLLIRENG